MNGSALATLYPAPTTRFGRGAAGFGLQIPEPLGGMARDYISLITVVLLSCTHPHSSRFVSALFFLNFFSFFTASSPTPLPTLRDWIKTNSVRVLLQAAFRRDNDSDSTVRGVYRRGG